MKIGDSLKNPKIVWVQGTKKRYLKFIFTGKLTSYEALTAIEEWRSEFDRYPKDNISLIWECTKMTDYDPKARIAWQKTIKDLKSQIDKIYLVTNSRVIKLGAKMISSFTSFDIDVFRSESEIKLV